MDKKKISKLEKQLRVMKVSKIMSKFAITATELTTVPDVAHLMMRFKISGVPIKNECEQVVGIVTVTDLFEMIDRVSRQMEQGKEPTDFTHVAVKEIMTKDVFSIDEGMSLYDVIRIMRERKIHTLPVLSAEGELVGVVGRRDVINASYSLSKGSKAKKG